MIVADDYESMSKRAGEIVIEEMKRKPDIVLGLATGSTPEGLYEELIKAYRQGQIDFSRLKTFNLDEYIGLPPAHSQSYWRFMFEKLFEQVNINYRNIHVPDGMTEDIDGFCKDYEEKIRGAGGIDLQILGIGVNGHIGFNEPGSPSGSRTKKVELTEETIRANSRFFESEDQVPRYAISMGQATIIETKKIILLASGKNKADAIAKAVEGPITEEVPASILQSHPDATVIVDREAGSKLKGRE